MTAIEPVTGGYRVHHDELKGGTRVPLRTIGALAERIAERMTP